MYCPKKMRLNAFKEMRCPNPRDLYERIGQRLPSNIGASDGSEYSDLVPFNQSKLDTIASIQREENTRLYEEYKASMKKSEPPAQQNEPSEPNV